MTSLDALLSGWAAQQRLSDAEAARVREAVVGAESPPLDQERLWNLLRPVTSLLEGPRSLHLQLSRSLEAVPERSFRQLYAVRPV
jgi:hypothetical protein